MAKNTNKQVEEVNTNNVENVDVTPITTPTVAPNVAPAEAVNVNAADPNVDNEATTTPDVSEEAPKRTKAQAKADAEFDQLVESTMNGEHGTGRERMLSLGENYSKVQQEITRRIRAKELERLK